MKRAGLAILILGWCRLAPLTTHAQQAPAGALPQASAAEMNPISKGLQETDGGRIGEYRGGGGGNAGGQVWFSTDTAAKHALDTWWST